MQLDIKQISGIVIASLVTGALTMYVLQPQPQERVVEKVVERVVTVDKVKIEYVDKVVYKDRVVDRVIERVITKPDGTKIEEKVVDKSKETQVTETKAEKKDVESIKQADKTMLSETIKTTFKPFTVGFLTPVTGDFSKTSALIGVHVFERFPLKLFVDVPISIKDTKVGVGVNF